MLEELSFVLIEDKPADRDEISSRLSDAGFRGENCLGCAETYDDARSLLEHVAERLDVVFLDLNLPRDLTDGRPEKAHGKRLLDFIHDDLNRRARNQIRVVVVSGEDLQDGMQEEVYRERYKGTLVGIIRKADLVAMLKSNLKRLRRDEVRARIARCGLVVLSEYDVMIDTASPIKERLKGARMLAVKLVQNEIDHHNNEIGKSLPYGDNLNGLIKDHIESRFAPDPQGRRFIKSSRIQPTGSWGVFLWRGSMVQHLYALNSYRNLYEHIEEQSFRCPPSQADKWTIPANVLANAEGGETLGKIVELIVRDLLEWYLPWHEQVYVHWAQAIGNP